MAFFLLFVKMLYFCVNIAQKRKENSRGSRGYKTRIKLWILKCIFQLWKTIENCNSPFVIQRKLFTFKTIENGQKKNPFFTSKFPFCNFSRGTITIILQTQVKITFWSWFKQIVASLDSNLSLLCHTLYLITVQHQNVQNGKILTHQTNANRYKMDIEVDST